MEAQSRANKTKLSRTPTFKPKPTRDISHHRLKTISQPQAANRAWSHQLTWIPQKKWSSYLLIFARPRHLWIVYSNPHQGIWHRGRDRMSDRPLRTKPTTFQGRHAYPIIYRQPKDHQIVEPWAKLTQAWQPEAHPNGKDRPPGPSHQPTTKQIWSLKRQTLCSQPNSHQPPSSTNWKSLIIHKDADLPREQVQDTPRSAYQAPSLNHQIKLRLRKALFWANT